MMIKERRKKRKTLILPVPFLLRSLHGVLSLFDLALHKCGTITRDGVRLQGVAGNNIRQRRVSVFFHSD